MIKLKPGHLFLNRAKNVQNKNAKTGIRTCNLGIGIRLGYLEKSKLDATRIEHSMHIYTRR